MKFLRGAARNVVVPVLLAIGLFLLLEGGCRVALRARTGAWPETRVSAYTAFIAKIGKAYRSHPFLVVAGRPDAVLDVAGHVVHFNASGQRATNVRNVPVPKPAGVFRIVCEGGSTTFDLLAADDASTWPARLGTLLRSRADVVNAGFPGWTSLESLVSLEIRDVDLQPDLLVVFSGINDLQPAGHRPFSPDYSAGHADILRRVTGVTPIPVSLAARSVFIEWLLGRVAPRRPGETAPSEGFMPSYDREGGPPRDDIPAEAIIVYERNLRSTIAVARAHGAQTLLVAQTARVRAGHEADDRAWLEALSPGLTTAGYFAGLKRYNAVAKKLGEEGLALFLDPFATGSFGDESFLDPAHFSPAGSENFARTLAAFIEAPGGPMAARRE